MATREEHLAWCKAQPKLGYARGDSLQEIWAAFVANMKRHAHTQDHASLLSLGRMVSKELVLYSDKLIEEIDLLH